MTAPKTPDEAQSWINLQTDYDLALLVATGNIGNNELERLVAGNLQQIVDALGASGYVELGRDKLVCHE
jgi:predicted nuclease of predicted toxin-antitoxin system